MKSEFLIYLELGIQHIADLDAYDHMLFVVVLCAAYKIGQWKELLVLVTAFTVGHSLTLALSGLELVKINARLVETLIPITILLTAVHNIYSYRNSNSIQNLQVNYLLALGFGLIHGLGFASFFKAMMGTSEGTLFPLFAFNVGIELGQLVIVAILLCLLFVCTRIIKLSHRQWNLSISSIGVVFSIFLIYQALSG